MKKQVLAVTLALTAALMVSGPARAGDGVEEELEAAQRALEDAARRLAEVHGKHHSLGQKKAMLGVLLGDGPMVGGVEIVGTTPNGGAAQAGLEAGDLIVEIGDMALEDVDDPMGTLSKYMKGVTPGEAVAVEYVRDGTRHSVTIVTQPRSAHIMHLLDEGLKDLDFDFHFDDFDPTALKEGIRRKVWQGESIHSDQLMAVSGDLASYFGVERGIVVVDPAEGSDLRGGDVLLKIGDEKVEDLAGAVRSLAAASEAQRVEIKRDGRDRTVSVKPGEFALAHMKEVRIIRMGEKNKP